MVSFKIIESRKNETIKFVKSLYDKKNREINKLIVVEGKKFIQDLHAFDVKFKMIFFLKELYNEFKDFIDLIECEKYLINKNVLDYLSSKITPQGILAIVKMPDVTQRVPPGHVLILDNIQDAGNLGTILRTALATNFLDVILLNCVDVFNEKVINSSMTAIFKLNLLKLDDLQLKDYLIKYNLKLLIADLDGINAFEYVGYKDDFALLIGSEGQGVNAKLKDLANDTITLPMNKNIESLNASVSAGILMYLIDNKGKTFY